MLAKTHDCIFIVLYLAKMQHCTALHYSYIIHFLACHFAMLYVTGLTVGSSMNSSIVCMFVVGSFSVEIGAVIVPGVNYKSFTHISNLTTSVA